MYSIPKLNGDIKALSERRLRRHDETICCY